MGDCVRSDKVYRNFNAGNCRHSRLGARSRSSDNVSIPSRLARDSYSSCRNPDFPRGTFTAMYALGYSINLLTMFGLILVIGSLVDDAIVVVENCQSVMLRERVDAKTASIKSMKQITGAVIATTLVTIACYVPLAFYGGMVGEIYTQFAVTMCIALSISTLVALTLSPALCAILLKKEELSEKLFFKPVNFAINGGRNLYTKIVGFLAARLFLTFAIFCAVVGLSYFLFGYLKSSFIPMEDKGTIMCDIELPPGASLSRTEAATKKFENMIKKIGGVKNYMTVNGRGMVSGSGENVAMAIVELDDWDKRTTEELSLSSIVKRIQEGGKIDTRGKYHGIHSARHLEHRRRRGNGSKYF